MLSDDSHSRRDTAEASRNDDLEGERNGLLPDTFQLKTFVSWKYRAATVKSQAKRGGRMRTIASRFMYLSAGPQLVLPEGVLQSLAGALLQDARCQEWALRVYSPIPFPSHFSCAWKFIGIFHSEENHGSYKIKGDHLASCSCCPLPWLSCSPSLWNQAPK